MATLNQLSIKATTLVILAMTAFAANSVLCRLALKDTGMDAGLFTLVRLVSGAVMLALLIVFHNKEQINLKQLLVLVPKSGLSSLMLFCYAASFSYAYIDMETGTGALVLFASVQLAMIGYHLSTGNRFNWIEAFGLMLALIGFIYLLFPSASSPALIPALLMIFSGISWAIFTLLGKQNALELSATSNMAVSFIGATALAVLLLPWFVNTSDIALKGIYLAIGSGAVASALGYAIWYSVLPIISVLQASIVQLSVPAIAAIGGVIIVGESMTIQLFVASIVILGGILLVFIGRKP
ncbi:DMT family transporter [Vibrio hannami]|uniref:DMT family transporter n=1 Tax=Vibrio hannami TaxID=2717094 RepID=UPI00240EEA23|nr:DMT family transporter [Vibrio hannami]MDG3088449.1 DMT family transporter [Vibrio hannami]